MLTHALRLSRYRTREASETSHGCFRNRMHQSALGDSKWVFVHLCVSESLTASLYACPTCMFMHLYLLAGVWYVIYWRNN